MRVLTRSHSIPYRDTYSRQFTAGSFSVNDQNSLQSGFSRHFSDLDPERLHTGALIGSKFCMERPFRFFCFFRGSTRRCDRPHSETPDLWREYKKMEKKKKCSIIQIFKHPGAPVCKISGFDSKIGARNRPYVRQSI